MKTEKEQYSELIHNAVDYRLLHDFAFGYIRFEWVYNFPYITIVDKINQLYLQACEDSENKYNQRDPFRMVSGEIRFEYGTTYIANILYDIAKYYEFKYNTCMTCSEHGTYCDMDRSDVRKCMEIAENKYWADLAAPSWEE